MLTSIIPLLDLHVVCSFIYCRYDRVETLSGFANGLFLVVVSFFILLAAVSRVMHPPHINTDRLLVSMQLHKHLTYMDIHGHTSDNMNRFYLAVGVPIRYQDFPFILFVKNNGI